MNALLTDLGISNPVLAAPMAGGPSTPKLVIEAGRAGSLGFLAAGYKDVDSLTEQVRTVRAADTPFGVNLFAPNPVPISPQAYRTYADLLQPEADDYGIALDAIGLREDDDQWNEKIAALLAGPVPVVSFTFGIPSAQVIAALRKAGTVTIQTVTSPAEAQLAADVGIDVLMVQASAAGGHSGTLTPDVLPAPIALNKLIGQVTATVSVPVIGAGGISRPHQVASAMTAGAGAVAVGTVLLRSVESGASDVHQAALVDPSFTTTVVTRAFTGRPARALRNHFTDTYSDIAPSGYPALHHLTSPVRKAATAAGDVQRVHLWAGTGYADSTTEPVRHILDRLASG